MKILKISLLLVCPFFLVAALLLIFPTSLDAQHPDTCRQSQIYLEHEMFDKIDSLRSNYGQWLDLEKDEYELPLLIALSHYPSLKDTKIQVVYKNTRTPLYARPHLGNFFRKEENHVYRLIVDRKSDHVRGKSLNAQVGVFAHELGHLIFYKQKNLFGIIGYALNYGIRKNYRLKDEKRRDQEVIEHGLSWQLYHFAELYTHTTEMREIMKSQNCYPKELANFFEQKNELMEEKQYEAVIEHYRNYSPLASVDKNVLALELYSSTRYHVAEQETPDIEAITQFVNDAIVLFPESPCFYHLMAEIHHALGKDEEAIEMHQKALEVSPGDLKSTLFLSHKEVE